jgi:hypothetical protein
MDSITIVAPTGTLGYGFDPDALGRAMTFKPALIGVDAGSTDPGPYYLGTGEPLAPRIAVERELEQLLRAVLAAKIPLLVGSCGGSGSNRHLEWTAAIVRDLARKHAWRFRMALIPAEIPVERVLNALRDGKLTDFEAGFMPTEAEIRQSAPIVAQMGPEPFIAAMEAGAQVVLAGRACDDAIFAAMPILRGFDPGLATHMGKILECGAFCAVPFAMDVILGTLDLDGFTLEPGSLGRRCTVASVAGHSLYEREDPYVQRGPGGYVDMRMTRFVPLDDRRVRVTGTRFVAERPYRVKLEAARRSGYRTASIAGIRCPTMIQRIEPILADVRKRMETYFTGSEQFTLLFHVYGKDGVMGSLEARAHPLPHELGLVTEVIAPSQELAHAVCHVTTGTLLHYSYEGQKNNAGNLAFLHSPSEIDAGPAHVFSLYHLMEVDDPAALFPIQLEEV